jgi:hypothetical protein
MSTAKVTIEREEAEGALDERSKEGERTKAAADLAIHIGKLPVPIDQFDAFTPQRVAVTTLFPSKCLLSKV